MNGKQLWLYGFEDAYMERLAAYVRRRETQWAVRIFSSREELKAALSLPGAAAPDRLFLPEEAAEDPLWEGLAAVRIAVRTRMPGETEDARGTRVFLCQPASEIVRLLLSEDGPAGGDRGSVFSPRFLGFYSPVHGCGQTLAALTLAQLLAEKERVLYLDLERDPALGRYLTEPAEGSLSDVLYHVREGSSPRQALREACCRLGAMDLILPGTRREDMRCAGPDDWDRLVKELKKEAYQTVVLDIGEGPQEEAWLLRHCRKIIVTTRPDALAQEKEQSWWARLSLLGEEDLLERVIRVILPPLKEGFVKPGQLRYCSCGSYLRRFAEDMKL